MRALFDNVNGLRRNIIPPPASISGPTLVCSSGATFTIQNFPIGGATVLWTCSSNLIGGGTGGSTATFRAIESGNYGWIQATVNGVPLRYEVWVGAPVVVQIIGNDITTNDIERYEVLFPLLSRATQFRWRIDPDWGASLDSTTMPGVTIEFSRGGFYQLFATATNACGTSSEISISIYKA
jgi:hypothetical protein